MNLIQQKLRIRLLRLAGAMMMKELLRLSHFYHHHHHQKTHILEVIQ